MELWELNFFFSNEGIVLEYSLIYLEYSDITVNKARWQLRRVFSGWLFMVTTFQVLFSAKYIKKFNY